MGKYKMISGALALVVMALPSVANSAAIPIAPFTGDWVETFESFNNHVEGPRFLDSPSSILEGNALIFHPLLTIYEPGAADFNLGSGGPAKVREGVKGLGINTPPGFPEAAIAEIVFDTRVRQFGAYWAAVPDQPVISFEFFDINNSLVDRIEFAYDFLSFRNNLQWQGWTFDEGVKRITVAGFAPVLDYAQASPVPIPSVLWLCMSGVLLLFMRKKSCRRI